MKPHHFFIYSDNTLKSTFDLIVNEFPIQLIVNGHEIATLIGSPHDLRYLVAGFLRLQGFVRSLDDFELFSVCEEFGTANIRLKIELPEKLKPVLTSGCGTGITFSLPENGSINVLSHELYFYKPTVIINLMDELSKRAENYKKHGGIHSAAIARHGNLILYSEDLGRHNTIDRIAGEALFRGINLNATELATSGRVSSEMVAKASLMGVRLIASRTSATDMAVQLAEKAGICLLGYVRNSKFIVYSHPEMIDLPSEKPKTENVTAVILAGGSSSRMGSNKALLKINGVTIIENAYRNLSSLFHEVIIVTNNPELYEFIPCRKVPDLYSNIGSIAGLHSGIFHSSYDTIFVIACDMPNINPGLILQLYNKYHCNKDALIPFSQGGQEPLHAFYSRKCLPVFTSAIENGNRKILDCINKINTILVRWDEIREIQGAETAFINVNTPEEYSHLKN